MRRASLTICATVIALAGCGTEPLTSAAPWIGRVVAVCFVAIWITSGYAFFTNSL